MIGKKILDHKKIIVNLITTEDGKEYVSIEDLLKLLPQNLGNVISTTIKPLSSTVSIDSTDSESHMFEILDYLTSLTID